MGITRTYWKFFLQDAVTSLVYYIDDNGHVQKGNPLSKDYSLPQSPGGWDGIQLAFGRSSHYWGINRTFTIPLKFIGDGAKIVRTLFYNGKGIEESVNLVILKWDDVNGVFSLYYNGRLDLSKIDDMVAEGVTVNIMEGGAVQFLKAFESSVIPLPLDGSIPENIKVNADGILLNDAFHYSIIPVTNNGGSNATLPVAFLSNDGDNIGITKATSTNFDDFATAPLNYLQVSSNFLFSSEEAVTVRIRGSIIWKPASSANIRAQLYVLTNLSRIIGSGPDNTNSYSLVPGTAHFYDNLPIQGQTVSYFDRVIPLAANERMFLLFSGGDADHHLSVIGGSFTLTFSSRYRASRVWALKPYDVGALLFERLNALSSAFGLPTAFGFDSSLLKTKQNIVLTSGDAARASTDPTYYQYFNQATINPTNPNNSDYNQFPFIGPALKISIMNLFDGYNPILNASLSNQQLPNVPESIFLERKGYVLDPSVVTMVLEKISNLRVSIAMDYYWNWLKIGYKANDYDEKAGKYEYNNTNQYQAPIKSIGKTLELISAFRADSYGFEYTRYNTQGGKSTTFNNSDSIFALNVDFSSFFYDYYKATFDSAIPDPTFAANTNQKLLVGQKYQPVFLDTLDGDYFATLSDYSIFTFNQPLSSVSFLFKVQFSCLLNGLVGDSATIKMYINGVVVQTWAGGITGVDTPFDTPPTGTTFSHNISTGDNLYFTVDTVRTCSIQITDFTLSVGAAYFVAQLAGAINMPAGSTQQLISLPLITPTLVSGLSVVSYGYQYFRFLSTVGNTDFDWSFAVSGYTSGGAGQPAAFDVWRNGVNIGTITYSGSSPAAQFNPSHAVTNAGTLTFGLYDLIWITGSAATVNVWVSYLQLLFTSKSVKVYNLLRPAFSNVSGIPNPQTAFNIEDLTPGRMLKANGSLLKSSLFNLMPGMLSFQTADKNRFLSTTLAGNTITEGASIDIHDLDDPLFYPLIFEFDTEVPVNFSDLLSNSANGHIEFIYNNKSFYGFPVQVTAKPALNESQTWKLLCSPKTNLSDLVDLDWDGLLPLMPLDISIPIVGPLHWVPLGYTKGPQYHNYTMDQDWYVNRIQAWIDQSNYYAPWQTNESIQLQCQTSGLSPATVQILDCKGKPVGSPIDIPSVDDPSVLPNQTLFQGAVGLSLLAEGYYYLLWSIGTGQGTGVFISEGIQVKNDWGYNTLRFDYSNSRNKLATVFTSDYLPSFRIHGQINRYTPKSKFTTFIDQPQDIDLLNAIPYDTWKLEIGRSSGVPDYIMRKIDRILLLDTVYIEGDQYSRDADAQWEKQNFPGQAKEYMTLDIRRAKNEDAITLNTSGQLDNDQQAGYTLDPRAFGFNNGQDLVYVSNS
jgi:hypothetical protein